MKAQNSNQSEIGVTTSPEPGEFKWVYSDDKNNHSPKDSKKTMSSNEQLDNFIELYEISPVVENHSYYCVVCGRDAKPGMGSFCSISCQSEQTGV